MSPDMKITQVKSNGKSLKNIELPDVMTAIRSGEQARYNWQNEKYKFSKRKV